MTDPKKPLECPFSVHDGAIWRGDKEVYRSNHLGDEASCALYLTLIRLGWAAGFGDGVAACESILEGAEP